MSVPDPRSLLRAVVAMAAAVLIAGCGVSGATLDPTVTADGSQRVEVGYLDGAVEGGVARYAVPLGSTVELVIVSDVADEVHLHGYDRFAFVTAGASATLRFVADVPGVFEVELEQRAVDLVQLEVS